MLKSFLSLLTVAFFIWIGYASFGSSNTEVSVLECVSKPPVTHSLLVRIFLLSSDTMPVALQHGQLFLLHQKITDTLNCQYIVDEELEIDFTVDEFGYYSYTTNLQIHNNSGDLWRAEVCIRDETQACIFRKVQVAFYDTDQITFQLNALPPL